MERDYFDLAANHAAVLRADIERACRAVAKKIVEDLFVSTQPARNESGPSAPGQVWTVSASVPSATSK